MNTVTSNEIDEAMSEIGMRIANATVGKPVDGDDIDDILVDALSSANKDQLYEVVDNMIDLLSLSEILNLALSDDSTLDADETDEFMDYLEEIEHDTKAVIKSLVTVQ